MDSSRGNAVLDRLHLALGELRLGEVDALLESHLQRAAQGDRPYADFLLDVLEAEMRARQEMRYQNALKRARLPFVKTLPQFDFCFQPSIDQAQVRELQTLRFVHEASNVLFLGPPGVGASGLARARRTWPWLLRWKPSAPVSRRSSSRPMIWSAILGRRPEKAGWIGGCAPW